MRSSQNSPSLSRSRARRKNLQLVCLLVLSLCFRSSVLICRVTFRRGYPHHASLGSVQSSAGSVPHCRLRPEPCPSRVICVSFSPGNRPSKAGIRATKMNSFIVLKLVFDSCNCWLMIISVLLFWCSFGLRFLVQVSVLSFELQLCILGWGLVHILVLQCSNFGSIVSSRFILVSDFCSSSRMWGVAVRCESSKSASSQSSNNHSL